MPNRGNPMIAAIARGFGRVASAHRPADTAAAEASGATRCAIRRVRRHETLFCAGDPLAALFVVRLGTLKSVSVSREGLRRVIGFPVAGDAIGLDGMGTGHYLSEVVALVDAELFVLPIAQGERHWHASASARRLLARTLSFEAARRQDHKLLLTATPVEQRMARFLLDMSERQGCLGGSRSDFVLRMSRHEIGSYLGLQLEQVRQSLSCLQKAEYIRIQGKSMVLLDIPALWRASGSPPVRRPSAITPLVDVQGMPAMGNQRRSNASLRPSPISMAPLER